MGCNTSKPHKTKIKSKNIVKWNYLDDMLYLNRIITSLDPTRPISMYNFRDIDNFFHPLLNDLVLAINYGNMIDLESHDKCLDRVLGEKEKDMLYVAMAKIIKHGSICKGTYFNDCMRTMKPGARKVLILLLDLIISGKIVV